MTDFSRLTSLRVEADEIVRISQEAGGPVRVTVTAQAYEQAAIPVLLYAIYTMAEAHMRDRAAKERPFPRREDGLPREDGAKT